MAKLPPDFVKAPIFDHPLRSTGEKQTSEVPSTDAKAKVEAPPAEAKPHAEAKPNAPKAEAKPAKVAAKIPVSTKGSAPKASAPAKEAQVKSTDSSPRAAGRELVLRLDEKIWTAIEKASQAAGHSPEALVQTIIDGWFSSQQQLRPLASPTSSKAEPSTLVDQVIDLVQKQLARVPLFGGTLRWALARTRRA